MIITTPLICDKNVTTHLNAVIAENAKHLSAISLNFNEIVDVFFENPAKTPHHWVVTKNIKIYAERIVNQYALSQKKYL